MEQVPMHPSEDYEGNQRPQGNEYDIGTYERWD